jgi:DNA polymerase III subunit alpha
MKYPGYFLIVADFIQWAKAQGHSGRPGPRLGRRLARRLRAHHHRPRSAPLQPALRALPQSRPRVDAGLRHRLLPGPARRGHPLRAGEIRRDQVAQIITFGTLQARAVLRDVGRVLQMPYGQVDRHLQAGAANPANPVTLAQAIEDRAALKQMRDSDEPSSPSCSTSPRSSKGLYRHASTHAAGIVIGDRPLTELVPLYRDPRSDMPVTQFNMKWVEQAGLVKFDFLGLKTLTCSTIAVKLIRRRGIEIDRSPTCRSTTEDLRDAGARRDGRRVPGGSGRHAAGAGRHAARPLRGPDRAGRALPAGPDGQHPDLLRAQARRDDIEYLHPMLEPILEPTYGVITYQEQVMQIAAGPRRLLARRSRSAAPRHGQEDQGRDGRPARALRQGRASSAASARASPTPSSMPAPSSPNTASTSRTRRPTPTSPTRRPTSRRTPVEFLAASMTLDMGNTDKLNEFRRDAKKHGIEIVPPCVNRSGGLAERLDREYAAIGFHLSGHPLDQYSSLFEKLKVKRWLDFEREVKEDGIGPGASPAPSLPETTAARVRARRWRS